MPHRFFSTGLTAILRINSNNLDCLSALLEKKNLPKEKKTTCKDKISLPYQLNLRHWAEGRCAATVCQGDLLRKLNVLPITRGEMPLWHIQGLPSSSANSWCIQAGSWHIIDIKLGYTAKHCNLRTKTLNRKQIAEEKNRKPLAISSKQTW